MSAATLRGWRLAKLKDLVFLQRGFDITKAQQSPGVYPVISSSGVTSFHSEYKVSGPGVIVGRKGTVGSVHFSSGNYWPHDTTLWSKDFHGNDPHFAYYFLRTIDLRRFDVGNSNPTLNRNHIHDLEILIPLVHTQERIAAVLSAYDELIENNHRRMALLEESARLLYREWFIRLRFPGYEHAQIIDGVPDGWERLPLTATCTHLKRGISPHYDDEAEGLVINQKCIREGRLNIGLARRQSREFDAEKQIQIGDVLVNSTGEGTLGRVAQVKFSVANCTVDSHVTIVRPRPGTPLHLFGLAILEWQQRFAVMGKGATNQTELSPTAIGRSHITIPSPSLGEQFEALTDPLYQQAHNLEGQNDKLRAARDLLLPKLMSGELAV